MKDKQKKLRSKVAFSNSSLLIFGLIFAVVGGYVLWRSFAAPPPPTIYLSPAAQTFGPSATFTVQVRENSSTTAVNAVQANISYPTALLTYVSVTDSPAFSVSAQTTGGAGSIQIARGTTTPVTGDQLVATITFTTTATSGTATLAFTTGTALVSSSSNTDILGGLAATGSGTVTVDVTAPAVSVTAPANGASIASGSTTTVTATATDVSSSVTKVEIYIDGALAATDTVSPYTYSWNTTGLSLGSHTVQAKGYDTFNNIGTSTLNTVTVADQTPPTTSITAPSGGSFLKGSVTFSATATDNVGGTGMAKVEFYVDAVLKNTDTVSPYSFSWDTTTATNASHSLTVKAYDNAATPNVTTSSAVSVTVDNSAPTAPGSFRTSATTLNSISLAWNASTDNNSVTAYQISRNGSVINTTSGATLAYTDPSLTSGTSFNYSIVAMDAAGNSSTASTLTASTLAAKQGDLNGDNAVDVTDLSILLSNFNTTAAVADINKDNKVDVFDLSILLSHFGT